MTPDNEAREERRDPKPPSKGIAVFGIRNGLWSIVHQSSLDTAPEAIAEYLRTAPNARYMMGTLYAAYISICEPYERQTETIERITIRPPGVLNAGDQELVVELPYNDEGDEEHD